MIYKRMIHWRIPFLSLHFDNNFIFVETLRNPVSKKSFIHACPTFPQPRSTRNAAHHSTSQLLLGSPTDVHRLTLAQSSLFLASITRCTRDKTLFLRFLHSAHCAITRRRGCRDEFPKTKAHCTRRNGEVVARLVTPGSTIDRQKGLRDGHVKYRWEETLIFWLEKKWISVRTNDKSLISIEKRETGSQCWKWSDSN